MENQDVQDYIVFVGNPGVGKSALLNGLVGRLAFESGTKGGTGLTYKLQFADEGSTRYGDTPGLADAEKRKKAAEEISKAMRKNGRYKLVFVVTEDALRIRPQDATTIKLVLEALPEGMPYGIIINKISRPAQEKLHDKPEELNCMLTQLNLNHAPTPFVFFNELDFELHDLDNVVKPVSEKLREFLDVLPHREIRPAEVKDVKADEFERMTEEFEKQMDAIKTQMEEQQQVFNQQMKELQNRYESELKKARGKGKLLGKLAKLAGATTSVLTQSPVPWIIASSAKHDEE